MLQIALATAHLHSLNIAHRDLKVCIMGSRWVVGFYFLVFRAYSHALYPLSRTRFAKACRYFSKERKKKKCLCTG